MKSFRCLMALGVLAGVGFSVGCNQQAAGPPPAVQRGQNKSTKPDSAPLGLVGKVMKKVDFVDYSNEMKQLVLFYKTYELERGHPPKSVKEFQDYIKRDAPQLVKWMDEQYYVVLPNVRTDSQNVIVYQNRDLRGGTRWVAMGDASIQEVSEAEFPALKKKQGF